MIGIFQEHHDLVQDSLAVINDQYFVHGAYPFINSYMSVWSNGSDHCIQNYRKQFSNSQEDAAFHVDNNNGQGRRWPRKPSDNPSHFSFLLAAAGRADRKRFSSFRMISVSLMNSSKRKEIVFQFC